MEFKNRAALTKFIRKTDTPNDIIYDNMRLLFNNLQDKSEDYLDEVIMCVKDGSCHSRTLDKYIKCNKDVFDITRFMQMVKLLKEDRNTLLMYLPEYHSLLNGVTIEEGVYMVAKLKKDKATSKEGFIRRHGISGGTEMFKRFQDTSSLATNILIAQGFDFRVRSHWCTEHWENKGYSKEDAVEAVKSIQNIYAGVNPTVWRAKGYCEEEVNKILSEIHSRKGAAYSFDKLQAKNPELSSSEINELLDNRKSTMVNTFIIKGYSVPISDRDKYSYYIDKVRRMTEKANLQKVVDIEKRSVNFHLDHKYSIFRGFMDNVPAEIIASTVNLEIVPAKINLEKSIGCSISIGTLLKHHNLLNKLW